MRQIKLILVSLLLLAVATAYGAGPKPIPGDLRFERLGEGESNNSIPPSIFPHWVHRLNYRCDTCHDSLFEMKRGGTPVSMDSMKAGENCGACHDGQLAFAVKLNSCNRCHVAAAKPEE
jgi:c(7)-type cytochrome triheme protein